MVKEIQSPFCPLMFPAMAFLNPLLLSLSHSEHFLTSSCFRHMSASYFCFLSYAVSSRYMHFCHLSRLWVISRKSNSQDMPESSSSPSPWHIPFLSSLLLCHFNLHYCVLHFYLVSISLREVFCWVFICAFTNKSTDKFPKRKIDSILFFPLNAHNLQVLIILCQKGKNAQKHSSVIYASP